MVIIFQSGFLPNSDLKPGALLFFHGGGWVIGNIETYTPTCAHMADVTGKIVYSVDYRLAPEHPFLRAWMIVITHVPI